MYVFAGEGVQSPALLSAGPILSRVAFGIALPVIFTSGSINTSVLSCHIHGRILHKSDTPFINTTAGWVTWIVLLIIITTIAFVLAEVIPVFEDILSVAACLLVSGFSFYIPPVMWFELLRKGSWKSRKTLPMCLLCALPFFIGIIVMIAGTYAAVRDLVRYSSFMPLWSWFLYSGR